MFLTVETLKVYKIQRVRLEGSARSLKKLILEFKNLKCIKGVS
jgi:hypothetical protein